MRLTDFRLYAIVVVLSFAGSLGAVLIGRSPTRNGADEFAYLLGAQTFAAGRLTNPTHAHWEFFETYHVLAQPSYMAKYPPAQSLALALGYKLGHPIVGVWLTGACFALATAWLARARLSRRWALLGGIFVILQFGATHYYAQSYWGGAVTATAGALVVGATLRLARRPAARDAAWLGLGIALGLLSRPFETVLLCIVPGLLCLKWLVAKTAARPHYVRGFFLATVPIVAVALIFQAALNQAVTGQWWRLPYTAYETQYSGAPLFVWQAERPMPVFHNEPMAIFYKNFVRTLSRFDSPAVLVWIRRLYDLFLASLGPVLGAAVLGGVVYFPRAVRLAWSVVAVASVGFALSYWYFSHYYAGLHGACVLLGLHGLRVGYLTTRARRLPFAACALGFLALCVAARIWQDEKLRPLVTSLGYARQEIENRLVADGEKNLVFVRRVRPYNFHFLWVYNDADIDGSAVVWAHDLGPAENRKLIDYYHGSRRLWLLVESNDRPHLEPLRQNP